MTEQAAITEDEQTFKTNKGKEVTLVTDQHGLWLCKMQGQLPDKLSGRWTSKDRAEYDVEQWLKSQKPARSGDKDYEPKGQRSRNK